MAAEENIISAPDSGHSLSQRAASTRSGWPWPNSSASVSARRLWLFHQNQFVVAGQE